MLESAEFLILRLQILRKVFSFNERRVLELNLPHSPLLPTLPRVNHRILIDLLLLFQEVGHALGLNSFLELIEEDFIVYISVVIVAR